MGAGLRAGRNRAVIRLCALEEIPDGQARGFQPWGSTEPGVIVWRRGAEIRVYENSCPHVGAPLDWLPDRFMTKDGERLMCATHGATFDPRDGACLSGPCRGDRLRAVKAELRDGAVFAPDQPD